MKNHTISIKDFTEKVVMEEELACSTGEGSDKSLKLFITILNIEIPNVFKSKFVVTDHDKTIYSGNSIKRAIGIYNKAE